LYIFIIACHLSCHGINTHSLYNVVSCDGLTFIRVKYYDCRWQDQRGSMYGQEGIAYRKSGKKIFL